MPPILNFNSKSLVVVNIATLETTFFLSLSFQLSFGTSFEQNFAAYLRKVNILSFDRLRKILTAPFLFGSESKSKKRKKKWHVKIKIRKKKKKDNPWNVFARVYNYSLPRRKFFRSTQLSRIRAPRSRISIKIAHLDHHLGTKEGKKRGKREIANSFSSKHTDWTTQRRSSNKEWIKKKKKSIDERSSSGSQRSHLPFLVA